MSTQNAKKIARMKCVRAPKMSVEKRTMISEKITQILRHTGIENSLNFDPEGFTSIKWMLRTAPVSQYKLKKTDFDEIVYNDDSNTYQYNKRENMVRCREGHTGKILNIINEVNTYECINNADEIPICIYGTYKKTWYRIKHKGIRSLKDYMIKMSCNKPSNFSIHITIDVQQAIDDGIEFFKSPDNFIYTKGIRGVIDPKYFKNVEQHSIQNMQKSGQTSDQRSELLKCYGVIIFNKDLTKTVLVCSKKSKIWGFPKGKRESGEDEYTCAFRELYEETGISKSDVDTIMSEPHNIIEIKPKQDRFIRSVGYYIGIVDESFEPCPTVENELTGCQWFNIEEAKEILIERRADLLQSTLEQTTLLMSENDNDYKTES
jgi:2'-phosphotransferase